jgi:16S rRNA processing protein RimM
VFVQLVTDRTERLDVGASLHTLRNGRPVELFVEAARVLSNGRWVVKFDQITSRNDAETWNNSALHGAPITDDDVLWIHELIGASVVEVDGTPRGTCVGVLANPASDILELDTGALVPSNFVVSNIAKTGPERVITVDVPDGLFELTEPEPTEPEPTDQSESAPHSGPTHQSEPTHQSGE